MALVPILFLWKSEVMIVKTEKYFPSLKSREKIYAISLSFPATWSGVTLDAFCTWIRRLSIRIRVPAAIYAEDIMFWCHGTAGMMSQKVPICSSSRRICVLSSASQFISRPTNCSSLMVMCPCRFASLMRESWMSCGISICHRNGFNFLIPMTQTTPAPSLHASL